MNGGTTRSSAAPRPYRAPVSETTPTATEATLDPDVRRALLPLVASRFASNLSLRFVYPFLPAIARGLGVSLETAGIAVSVRELTGVLGPQVGKATDRGRSRSIMLASLTLLAVSTALGGLSTGIVVFTIAMSVVALSQMAFMISSAAWLSERVSYARRGTIFGLTELSWAGAFLVGVPVLGLLIERFGWRAPFFVVGALAAVLTVAVARTVPHDETHDAEAARPVGRRHPGALAVYVMVGLVSIAVQLVIVVYGAWFEDAFGFSVAVSRPGHDADRHLRVPRQRRHRRPHRPLGQAPEHSDRAGRHGPVRGPARHRGRSGRLRADPVGGHAHRLRVRLRLVAPPRGGVGHRRPGREPREGRGRGHGRPGGRAARSAR